MGSKAIAKPDSAIKIRIEISKQLTTTHGIFRWKPWRRHANHADLNRLLSIRERPSSQTAACSPAKKVQRVGSPTTRPVDVRVIGATHRQLRAMVAGGQFREDLYYRLSMIEIPLPGLLERKEDLPLLQKDFVSKFATQYEKPIAGITRRAQRRMATYAWPGNVRELENVIGNAAMMTEGNTIDLADLPEPLRSLSANNTSVGDDALSMEEVQNRHVLHL